MHDPARLAGAFLGACLFLVSCTSAIESDASEEMSPVPAVVSNASTDAEAAVSATVSGAVSSIFTEGITLPDSGSNTASDWPHLYSRRCFTHSGGQCLLDDPYPTGTECQCGEESGRVR